MSLNQQLSARVLVSMPSRVIALMALAAIVLIAAGCQTSEVVHESRPAVAPAPADTTHDPANDMTATEAAVAGLNEAPAAETSAAPTSQLLRPDAPVNYTVKRGDTLWDISAVFLKDPWFWPEIWQINPQVENPHLIYPGDVLSLAVGAGGDAHVFISQYSGARLQPRLRSEDLEGPIDTMAFSAIAAFLSKPSVVTEEQVLAAPHIVAFRDGHMIGGEGHEAYVRNLNAPLNQRFSVMHVAQPIYDFETNELVGYQAAYVATAVVNRPGEITRTILTEGSREALRGDRLMSQEGEESLSFKPHASTTNIDGQIIAIADEASQVGNYQVVVLNRRQPHELTPGVVLAVDQRGEVMHDVWGKRPFGKDALGPTVQLPFERAGTLIVFKVFNRVSYGLVIGARAPMQVADRVYNPN